MAGALCSLSNQSRNSFRLLTPKNAAALDKEAAAWGLNPFALVEAAGRFCAAELQKKLKGHPYFEKCLAGPILACAGSGNNGADALVMLRTLLFQEQLHDADFENKPYIAAALLSRFSNPEENTPRSAAVKALEAMGVPVFAWNDKEKAEELFKGAALIIDGIAGTGIHGALEGAPLEMINALDKRRNIPKGSDQERAQCCVVSIDVPSGSCGAWKPNMPVVHADFTLVVEPQKTVLYTPALRTFCGKIIPVKEVFPPRLQKKYGDAELCCWKICRTAIPPVPHDAYKYTRGVVEIHAGSPGSAGAARIAAAGASAAGAGMVRLILDDLLYPVLASSFGGIMAVPASAYSLQTTSVKDLDAAQKMPENRFKPDTILLGPGWGRAKERLAVLRQALEEEALGTPLILDADSLALLKILYPDICKDNGTTAFFHGNAVLTPHAGELEAFSGIPKEQLLSDPSIVAGLARKLNALILFKSHVMIVAGTDGKLGFIDGMDPSLGAGGSGDLLAGLCAGIAARIKKSKEQGTGGFNLYAVAAAAGTLLAAASRRIGRRFHDPLELAGHAAVLAGKAWLPEP